MIAELIRGDEVVTCGTIITEIFSGVKNRAESRLLKKQFDLIPYLALDRDDFFRAGERRASLKRRGIRVKTVDILIAHLALREKIRLLHHDSDFNRIARFFPLQILAGSLGH